MNWFRRKPTQSNYVEAAITVASNLYLHTIPGVANAPAPLQFNLPDSRYRYMIFCLSTVVTAALAYDEKKQIQPELLIKGCLHFAIWTATERPKEYFDNAGPAHDPTNCATAYLKEFLSSWSRWPELEKNGKNAETIELIASMVHTTETRVPIDSTDLKRLGDLALEIHCRLPTMRGALIELTQKNV